MTAKVHKLILTHYAIKKNSAIENDHVELYFTTKHLQISFNTLCILFHSHTLSLVHMAFMELIQNQCWINFTYHHLIMK